MTALHSLGLRMWFNPVGSRLAAGFCSLPFISVMARSRSCSMEKRTKPYPLLRCVTGSNMTCGEWVSHARNNREHVCPGLRQQARCWASARTASGRLSTCMCRLAKVAAGVLCAANWVVSLPWRNGYSGNMCGTLSPTTHRPRPVTSRPRTRCSLVDSMTCRVQGAA